MYLDTGTTENRKRKRESRASQQPPDIPWTVARCNRLIRTISSRILTLRRLSAKNVAARDSKVSNTTAAPGPDTPFRNERLSGLSFLTETDSPRRDDPEWMPRHGQRLTSRTYGCRGAAQRERSGSHMHQHNTSAKPHLQTPFIKRLLRPKTMGSPPARVSLSSPEGDKAVRRVPRKSKALPIKPNTSLEQAHQSLVKGFESFLVGTRALFAEPRIGTRSLVATCLRRMPDFMAVQQDLAKAEGEDEQYDAETETYTFLENLGSAKDSGWAGLRQVVRSHGLKMILDAITEKLFLSNVVKELLEVCDRCQAIAESQAILHVWCMDAESPSAMELSRLVDWSFHMDYIEFFFRNLGDLLEEKRVSERDLLKHGGIWRAILQALQHDASRGSALRVLESYIAARISEDSLAADMGRRESDGNEFLHSIAVLMTAIAWTCKADGERTLQSTKRMAKDLHRLAMGAVMYCRMLDVGDLSGDLTAGFRNAQPFLLCSLIIQTTDSELASDLEGFDIDHLADLAARRESIAGNASNVHKIIGHRPGFVCQVAKCLAYADTEGAHEMLQVMVNGLIQASKRPSGTASGSAFLRDLAVDSAMAWAEHRDDNDSHSFAEDIESFAFGRKSFGGTIQTPIAARRPRRFRWEAGLCEWIAATPLGNVTFAQTVEVIAPIPFKQRQDVSSPSQDRGPIMQAPHIVMTKRRFGRASITSRVSDASCSGIIEQDELSLQTPAKKAKTNRKVRVRHNVGCRLNTSALVSTFERPALREIQAPPVRAIVVEEPKQASDGRNQNRRSVLTAEDLSEDELGL